MSLAPRAPGSSALRPILLALLTATIILHAWMFFSLRRQIAAGYPDFTIFYTAGKCVYEGRGRQLYDLQTQLELQRGFAPDVKHRENALPFNHPPFEALLFVPLAGLPYFSAYLVWAVFNVALIVGFWTLLRPRLPSLNNLLPALPLLAMFAFFPVIVALLQGQDSILLLFLYGLAFSALATRRAFVAGVCLALALFKFQLVLPLVVVLLVRRQWKAVAGFSFMAFVLLLVSAAVVGWNGVRAYPDFVLRLNRSPGQAGIDPRTCQTCAAWLGITAPGRPARNVADHHAFCCAGGAGGALVARPTGVRCLSWILAMPGSHDHCQLPPVCT